MKKIPIFLILCVMWLYVSAHTFTAKELISIYQSPLKKATSELLKKGNQIDKFHATLQTIYQCNFRVSYTRERQLEIYTSKIMTKKKAVLQKYLNFYTDYWNDWLTFKAELEISDLEFNSEDSNKSEQRLSYDHKNIKITMLNQQYESGTEDTYRRMIWTPEKLSDNLQL
ncbi:MAG: hypothetical protein JSS98_08355 [Bacteroidetes bacterium]|nr:hypothetical protein [Bacteroidota bacterium]